MKKKYSAKELLALQQDVFDFTGEWEDLCGKPAKKGAWIVWGRSFSGKTAFCIRLARYIASLGRRVAYLSLEEGAGISMKNAWARENMTTENNRLSLWENMTIDEIKEELHKQRSPSVLIIDSLQYLNINYAGYKALREEFKGKLFVFISHATEQKEPMGTTAVKIKYDAGVKILVDGFVATAFSRYGGGRPMKIWHEGASQNTAKTENKYDRITEEWDSRRVYKTERLQDEETTRVGQMEEKSDCSDFRIPIIDARREILRRWGFGESGEGESSCESCCRESRIQQDNENEVDSNI